MFPAFPADRRSDNKIENRYYNELSYIFCIRLFFAFLKTIESYIFKDPHDQSEH